MKAPGSGYERKRDVSYRIEVQTDDPTIRLSKIFSKLKVVGECWEWQGAIATNKYSKQTYPLMNYRRRTWRGNRLVLFLLTGEIPDGKYACHKCDNKRCLRPDHLYWGTPQDNQRDMNERGRSGKSLVTHCTNGHEYVGDNVIKTKDGKRKCRKCVKMWRENFKKRQTDKLQGGKGE